MITVHIDYETIKGEKELWRGRQWAVTTHCIQGLGRWSYYFVELNRLKEDLDQHYSWLEHMAGMEWCDIRDFSQAFLVACVYRGVRIKNIGAIIQRARDKKARGIRYDRRIKAEARRMGYAKDEPFTMYFGEDNHLHPAVKR